jgi:hypothetical protein
VLYIQGDGIEGSNYEINSIDGKLVESGKIIDHSVSTANLKAGMYILKTKGDGLEAVQRFVKE